jgi:hypothetical protein
MVPVLSEQITFTQPRKQNRGSYAYLQIPYTTKVTFKQSMGENKRFHIILTLSKMGWGGVGRYKITSTNIKFL